MKKGRTGQRQPIRSGALTVVIACVMILLAVLALLSLVTAHADDLLADRQVVFAQENGTAERAGQEWLASMDDYLRGMGDLPEDTSVDGDVYSADLYYAGSSWLSVSATVDWSGDQPKMTVTKWEMKTGQADSGESQTESTEVITDILPETTVSGEGVS